jgi:Domain of unknown function (DUF4136)
MRMFLMRALAMLLLLPVFAACASAPDEPNVTTTYDHTYNFSTAHKIYIEPSSRTDPATIVVSDAQIERIDAALSTELTRKGFEMVGSSQQADLLITWNLIPKDLVKTDENASDCDGCDMAVVGGKRYSKGTLIVDVVDFMRNQPVWRSVLKTELTANPGSAEADKGREAAAAAMFANFPPQ